MPEFVSAPIPFKQYGNRRCLTGLQLCESPELAAFVKRFPDSFEPGPWDLDIILFVEPKDDDYPR